MMPTITAGSTVEIDIPAGDSYAVTTPVEAYVDIVSGTIGAGYKTDRLIGGESQRTQVYGPYAKPVKIRVRARTGGATYYKAAVEPPDSPDLVSVKARLSGSGVVKLSSCVPAKSSRWGLIGSSTIDNYLQLFASGNSRNYSARNFVNWLRSLSGQSFTVEAMIGRSGQRADEFLPLIDLLIARNLDVILIGPSALNMVDAQVPTLEESGAYAFQLVKEAALKAVNAGIRVICMTERGANSQGASARTQILIHNQLLEEFGATTQGVDVFPLHSVLWDASAAGNGAFAFKSGYMYDNTHQAVLGAYKVAKAILAWDSTLFRAPRNVLLSSQHEVYANNGLDLIDNPLFVTTTGGSKSAGTTGIAGDVPGDYVLARNGTANFSGTVTVEPNADGFGNDLVLDVTADAAGELRVQCELPGSSARIPAGKAIHHGIKIAVAAGAVNLQTVTLRAYGPTINDSNDLSPSGTDAGPGEAYGVVEFISHERISDAVTSITSGVRIVFTGAGSAKVTLSRHRARISGVNINTTRL